ncbi:DMT family transporter [Novosphingobium sp. 9U]|uniref:DMT family transporter n=1 Tax=Novosphingobium sp. 9U TaxID=2653158 RepID=UPI0012F2897C|nr:DMT family transporter [Novosphingobium sp. 9U]VWX55119.1 Membrane protein [Novosphingobium sp. 9U]
MSHQAQFWTAAFVMFLTGIGVPVLASLNAGLGRGLDNPAAATTLMFVGAFVFSLAALAVVGLPSPARFQGIPWQYYCGGVFMVFYILSVTYFAPRIGLGNAIFFVLVGQLMMAAAVDHFGWFGAIRTPLEAKRGIGILLMCFGIYLAKRTV